MLRDALTQRGPVEGLGTVDLHVAATLLLEQVERVLGEDAEIPERALEAGIAATLLGKLGGGEVGVIAAGLHRPIGELDRLLAGEGNPHEMQTVLEAHDAQAHRAMGELGRAERLDRRNLNSADASVRKLAKIGLVSTLLMQPHRLDEAVAVAEKDRHNSMMTMYALQDWPGIERALAGMRKSAGGAARVDALVIKLHGMALMHQGKYVEALPSFVEAYALQERILGPRHADTLRMRTLIGMCELECALLIGRRRVRSRVRRRAAVFAALASLLGAARDVRETLGLQDRTTVVAETTYIRALMRVGRHAEAKNAVIAMAADHTASSSPWASAIRREARACGATRGHS